VLGDHIEFLKNVILTLILWIPKSKIDVRHFE